ncbi:MAG TPA: exodeoxyribonuclease VII small subunit [Gemmatimonadales bacterium]|nr:exodeoxyribonuclease VII small subunit [Gemmatimonadales bacterium]
MAKQPRNANAAGGESDGSLSQDLARLEEIVRRLESDDGDLDQALKLFEEGVGRLRQAREKLAAAEAQVQKVLEEADGTLRMQPLDDDDL